MSATPVGLIGSLSVATRGRAGFGEVLVSLAGATESYLAWSDEPLPKRTRVLILAYRGARTVEVAQLLDEPEDELGFGHAEEPTRPPSELDL